MSFKCECCGGGESLEIRKSIYEANNGNYHDAVFFDGKRRVFRCSECGKIWQTEPTSDFMHFVAETVESAKFIPMVFREHKKTMKIS